MTAKRTNASLDGWFTVKQKSSTKSSVELECEDNGGDEVTEETVPAVKLISESHQTVTDTEQSTTLGITEVCLPNNVVTTTFQDSWSCQMDTLVLQENEYSIGDLGDHLTLSDQLSYSVDKECSSNEGSTAAGSGTRASQTPITDCQEAAGPSTISLLDSKTPAAECQELCCSTS